MGIEKQKDFCLSGKEHFSYKGELLDLSVQELWKWYFSDLIDIKSKVAEYLVTKALGFEEPYNTGYWSAHSIVYRGRRLELRSASYMKSIHDEKPSMEYIRHIDIRVKDCDVYIFSLLPGKTKEEADPFNLDNWMFYAIPAWYIWSECGCNSSITMSKVQRLVKRSDYVDLKADIDKAIDSIDKSKKD